MSKPITKTEYMEFLDCPKNTWLKRHKPELHALFELSDFEKGIVANGNLVEEWARKLLPDGVMVESGEYGPIEATKEAIERNIPELFQTTFVYDVFHVRNDMLKFDPATNAWNLYEVKGTNSLDERTDKIDHIEDASFQSVVMKDAGMPLNRVYLVHLNKEYVRDGDINIFELFDQEDITAQVREREQETRDRMLHAKEALLQEDESALECQCIYKGRRGHCTTFKHSHGHVPDYSVHDLSRIGSSKAKLPMLVDAGIFDLDDIPEDFKLSPNQRAQVSVHQRREPAIDHIAIDKELGMLKYPLYFLDYETYPSAIPMFDGFKPYQQIVFQFSLHVIPEPNGEVEHFEYVHESDSDPSPVIARKLKEYIGEAGTVIVWYEPFEKTRNKELGERLPEYRDFFADINSRVYDLMDIFSNQHYVHPGFKGKTSIKNVLPVLVPDLSYKEIAIQGGGTAMQVWFDAIFGNMSDDQKQKTFVDLKTYCGLDTYAMYAIWKVLMGEE